MASHSRSVVCRFFPTKTQRLIELAKGSVSRRLSTRRCYGGMVGPLWCRQWTVSFAW